MSRILRRSVRRGMSGRGHGFAEALESVVPVPVSTADFPVDEPLPVRILTHDAGWIEAEAKRVAPLSASLFLKASAPIRGGTSGGPVVTVGGQLLGDC